MEKVELTLPILEWKIDSENYGLIIKDSEGKYHYFNKDGTYDGWSKDTNIGLN